MSGAVRWNLQCCRESNTSLPEDRGDEPGEVAASAPPPRVLGPFFNARGRVNRDLKKCRRPALREQLSAGRSEGDEGPGFVHRDPDTLDRGFEARAVLGRATPVTEEKRLVDFLDVDAPLYRLDRIGDFEDPARGFFRVGIGAGSGVLHAAALSSLSTPRATILIASSGNGRCSALASSHGARIHPRPWSGSSTLPLGGSARHRSRP